MLGRVQVHAYAGGVPSMHLAFGLVVCEIVFSLSDRSRSARATEDAPSSSVAVSLHTATILLSVGLSASRALALPSLSVSELLCLPLALWAVGAPVVRVFFTSPTGYLPIVHRRLQPRTSNGCKTERAVPRLGSLERNVDTFRDVRDSNFVTM